MGGDESNRILELDGHSVRMALQGEGGSKLFSELYLWVPQQGGLPTGGKSKTLEVGFLELGRASGVFLSTPCSYMRIPVLEVVGLFSIDHTEEPADGWPDRWSGLFDDLPQQACSF